MNNDELRVYISDRWGQHILDVIDCTHTVPMSFKDEFLPNCTACGGNWSGILLTGIYKLWPNVWDAIPEDMGLNAWGCICTMLQLLQIDTAN